jgi:hypothetical protein
MDQDELTAFRRATKAAQARCEREKRKLCHVRWTDGHLEFTSRRLDGKDEEPRGWEIPPAEPRPAKAKRGSVQVELDL